MKEKNHNKLIVIIVVFGLSVLSLLINVGNSSDIEFKSLLISFLGISFCVFLLGRFKFSNILLEIWFLSQFATLYSSNNSIPFKIYDVTQAIRYLISFEMVYGATKISVGINILMILIYIIFKKLMLPPPTTPI